MISLLQHIITQFPHVDEFHVFGNTKSILLLEALSRHVDFVVLSILTILVYNLLNAIVVFEKKHHISKL